MRVAQINMVHWGSTGNIMLQIAQAGRKLGIEMQTFSTCEASIRYKKMPPAPDGHLFYGSYVENNLHYYISRITGKYGCYSYFATWRLIRQLKAFRPDLIHLHNLHSAFLNFPALFKYIKKYNIPVVWTLHDCWAFTGKCPHFAIAACSRWKTGCHTCPQMEAYPRSVIDSSRSMWQKKKKWYAGMHNLTIVTPSLWLADLTKESFLKESDICVINNGIDLTVFKPTESDFRKKYDCQEKFVILGVAFDWGYRKGLDVFIEMAKQIEECYQIVLVGTNDHIDKVLPDGIISIHKTQNQLELAKIYTAADLFVNPTREDNYPTVNMESLACGTPVLTFRTGGSPEIIDDTCGSTVECNDLDSLINEIRRIKETDPFLKKACITRSKSFDMNQKYDEYLELYKDCKRKN